MVLLCWTQRRAGVPQALHLSSYPDSNGPGWVMALWGAEQDYCDRSHTLNPPLRNPHTDTYMPQHAVQYRNAPTGTISYHSEGSESMVVCLQWEEQENRLQEKPQEHTRVTLQGRFYPAQDTCYLICYLMVSHTDVRTHCVVNNALLTVVSLQRRMNF